MKTNIETTITAKAGGVLPLVTWMEDGPEWKMTPMECEKMAKQFARLQADRERLLAALKTMISLHCGQEHLYGLTAAGDKLYRQADSEARAAVAACESRGAA